MIRGAIVHLLNEQPIVVDLFEMPSAGDVGLRCTNIRTLDGRTPVFVEAADSTFFFPYLHIRFLEIPGGASADVPGDAAAAAAPPDAAADEDLEIDEDFLRRIREA